MKLDMNDGSLNFFKRMFYLLIHVLPLTVIVALLKMLFHNNNWEILGFGHLDLISNVFTGLLFLLGFLLVGVLSDHKESERMPSDIITSLSVINRESLIYRKRNGAESLHKKLIDFQRDFKEFLTNKSEKVIELLDSFSEEYAVFDLDEGIPEDIPTLLRSEQTKLRNLILRIKIIRNTQFAPGVHAMVEATIFFYTFALLILDFKEPYLGVFFTSMYFFVLSSIFIIIKDMDNPFEYGKKAFIKVNEIDFSELDKFYETVKL